MWSYICYETRNLTYSLSMETPIISCCYITPKSSWDLRKCLSVETCCTFRPDWSGEVNINSTSDEICTSWSRVGANKSNKGPHHQNIFQSPQIPSSWGGQSSRGFMIGKIPYLRRILPTVCPSRVCVSYQGGFYSDCVFRVRVTVAAAL